MARTGPAGAGRWRARRGVLAGLAGLTLLALSVTVQVGTAMGRAGSPLFVPRIGPWGPSAVAAVGSMWIVMMVAMMTPSAAPTVLAFAGLERRRTGRERSPWWRTAAFLAGYLLVWVGFSVVAAVAQWGLRTAALLAPGMRAASPWLGAALLLVAGVYQLSPAKAACLRHCRTPVGFLLSEWRDGPGGPLVMGVRHGAYCTGCCWALMGLLFVAGVMNAVWCAALAALVLAEKALPGGRWLARAAGVGLVGWGLVLAVGAL